MNINYEVKSNRVKNLNIITYKYILLLYTHTREMLFINAIYYKIKTL